MVTNKPFLLQGTRPISSSHYKITILLAKTLQMAYFLSFGLEELPMDAFYFSNVYFNPFIIFLDIFNREPGTPCAEE